MQVSVFIKKNTEVFTSCFTFSCSNHKCKQILVEIHIITSDKLIDPLKEKWI